MSPEQLEELKELNSYYNNLLMLGETSFIYKGFEVTKKRVAENSELKWLLKNPPRKRSEGIKIPFFIQVIGAYSFYSRYQHRYIEKIVLPEGVEIIEERAFNGCFLEAVSLPSTLRKIDAYAFACCNLKELFIPDNVETIGRYGFLGNKQLRKISLPSGILLDFKAFEACGRDMFSTDLSFEVREKLGDTANTPLRIRVKGLAFVESPFGKEARKYLSYA